MAGLFCRPARSAPIGNVLYLSLVLVLLVLALRNNSPKKVEVSARHGRVLLEEKTKTWLESVSELKQAFETKQTERKMRSICFLSADMYGANGMGGTATALWLLANLVKKNIEPSPTVTWVGMPVPQQEINCTALEPLFAAQGINVVCLKHPRSKFWSNNAFRRMGQSALEWLRMQPEGTCDVIHAHEWGGFAKPIIMAKMLGEFQSTHVVVAPHGGHMWARQAMAGPRETSFFAQETDADERFVIENADSIVAPSQHMIDYLRQRGWHVAHETSKVIGNVQFDTSLGPMELPAIEPNKELEYKRIKNLVYFGRLQARKGLNLFLEAISTLAQRNDPDFIVYFIGGDNSGQYADQVRTMAATWQCQVQLHVGLPRAEALALLDSLRNPGALVVLPSLVENQPFTVAETALAELPMLSFDVGGVSEMLTTESLRETLVVPTAPALGRRLSELLAAGKACVPKLKDSVAYSWQTWIEWHKNVSIPIPPQITDELSSIPGADKLMTAGGRKVQNSTPTTPGVQFFQGGLIALVDPSHFSDAVHLRRALCSGARLADVTDTLAFVDAELEPMGGRQMDTVLGEMRRKLMTGHHRRGNFSAVSAGVHVHGSVAKLGLDPPIRGDVVESEVGFPAPPHWTPRLGSGGVCLNSVPLAIRKEAFCQDFTAEARSFRKFRSWMVALLLEQGQHEPATVGTVQQPLFTTFNTSSLLKACSEDHNPVADEISQGVALNLQSEWLLPARIARIMKVPAASSTLDFSMHQGHKGWRYKYATGSNTEELLTAPLRDSVYNPKRRSPHFQGAPPSAGTWSCALDHGYPQVGPQWAHPCSGGNCCDGAAMTAPALQYVSSLHIAKARLRVFARYHGHCGDGVRVVLSFRKADGDRRTLQDWTLTPTGIKGLVKYRAAIDVGIGDEFEIRVLPFETMDCDGLEFRIDLADPAAQSEYKSDGFLA